MKYLHIIKNGPCHLNWPFKQFYTCVYLHIRIHMLTYVCISQVLFFREVSFKTKTAHTTNINYFNTWVGYCIRTYGSHAW